MGRRFKSDFRLGLYKPANKQLAGFICNCIVLYIFARHIKLRRSTSEVVEQGKEEGKEVRNIAIPNVAFCLRKILRE